MTERMSGKNRKRGGSFSFLTEGNVFEALVLADGTVVDAYPSHTSKAEALCMSKLGVTRGKLWRMCPREATEHYLSWLLSICGAISVWSTFYKLGIQNELTKEQYRTLVRLKMDGLYKGAVTRWRL